MSTADAPERLALRSILEEGRGRAYPDMGWEPKEEPKEAFHALAAAYAA